MPAAWEGHPYGCAVDKLGAHPTHAGLHTLRPAHNIGHTHFFSITQSFPQRNTEVKTEENLETKRRGKLSKTV